MGILAWIIVGIIAGFLAKLVVPVRQPRGIVGDLIVGVLGAIVGGFIWNLFGHVGATGVNAGSILVAFVGGVILLVIVRGITGGRAWT